MSAVPDSRPGEDIVVLRDVMVPMRDGVRLAADIYLPAGDGPFSVILERTPYDKRGTNHADRTAVDPTPRSKPEVAADFARAGYAYVLQDCRGRSASEGVFSKYLNEADDGYDTLSWIADQPWCDGRIGMTGLSYSAHVQAAVASLGHPALAAMFMDSGGFSSGYHSGIRQGGAFELKQLTWAYKHALQAPATTADPARRAALEAEDIGEWARVNPWRQGHSPLEAAPEYEDFVVRMWARETFGDFWTQPDLCASAHYARFTDAPMVFMSSWYDPYALAATENFAALSRMKAGPVRLVMGPWTHGQRSVTFAGDADFGPDATLDGHVADDYLRLRLDWFDRHLRQNVEVADPLPSPVRLFVMGGGSGRRTAQGRLDHGGRWRDEADWPPPAAEATAFHLSSEGGLSRAVPATGQRAWRHDPANPVPTIGGAIASGAPLMEAGGFDQRETFDLYGASAPGRALAERDDVISFETEVLAEAVEVTGPVSARLWISASALDCDVMIKLVDVYPPNEDYPDGYALNLTHGVLRLRFRDGFETAHPMRPGEVYGVDIKAFPTSNLFAAGHRIRLDVSASNFPHFDVNPGTGVPAGEPCDPVVAICSVHFGPDTPSHFVLPIRPVA
ncbi:CocE/NonD family hydrolase [Brevundimonas sp.]|uniref:CocE/NonD family hydrolase n=1 Tax=Brevundimonas sp. TaxID=1871086 RepID=UPI003D0A4721